MIRKMIAVLLTARDQLQLTMRLLGDKRVPLWQKAIPALPLIYIFSPLNIITFALPIIGQIDDITLIVLSMELFHKVVDESILAEYKPVKIEAPSRSRIQID